MKRKALLSVILSAAMILGSVSPAFAEGQMSSDEVSVSAEETVSESRDEFETEHAGQDDGFSVTEQDSVAEQETGEEGEAEKEFQSEVAGIGEENPDRNSKSAAEEDSAGESKTDSAEEEEEKPENLVGAEGARISVGENVTAGFDSQTGTVTFYSNGGTLSQNWKDELGISWWDVVRVITISDESDVMYLPPNSSSLFQNLTNLQSLNLSKANTSHVMDMSSMFGWCSSLQTLDVSGFNTSNVTDMSNMFKWCSSLQTLDVSGFNTSNVTNMSGMFLGCSSLRTLNISGFDTSNVTDMGSMFSGCSTLRTLDVSGFNTTNVTNLSGIFFDCSSLRTLDVSGFNTSNTMDMSGMFSGCDNLRTLDVSSFYGAINMEGMFFNCGNLQTLDVSGLDTANTTNMHCMFSRCSSLQTIDVSGFNTTNATNMSWMFEGCNNLQTLDVSGFDTSNVTDISCMFEGCNNLQALDVSGFDTSNVTNLGFMFYGCSSLHMLDVSGFDTSNATDLAAMFCGCSSLQTLDVSGFDTSNATNMSLMFEECSNLHNLDVSGFDTSNATDLYEMFSGCSSLQKLPVSNFDISYVNSMDRMFYGCNSIQRLDLSSFDMEWVNNAGDLLSMCGDSELLVLLTPINVHVTIDLPYTFVDASGTEYNSLPEGFSESIRLTKKGADIPVDLEILSISDDYYGKDGTQASFHIDVQGSGTVSYQWQFKLDGSNNWNTPSQASAKTADYSFKLRPSYDNMQVRCIVADEYGFEVTSETRNVNVFALTSQPTDAVVADGQTVSFDVAATGQGLTYQWYFKRPNASWRKVTAAGYNKSSLPITGGEKNNGTSYRCVITDSAGNSFTSSSAKITVVATLQVTNLSEDFYGKVGTNASFHIDAVGKGNLSYQWQYKLAGQSNWRTPPQESAKTPDYVFKLRTSYDNIEVRCIVTDEAGNSCTSEVRKANVFAVTKQPAHVFAELGDTVTFAVKGIGQDLTYQWYFRRLEGDWKKVTVAGGNTASLTITAQVKNNGSQYRCYVYDGLGNLIKSQAAMLIEMNEEYEG